MSFGSYQNQKRVNLVVIWGSIPQLPCLCIANRSENLCGINKQKKNNPICVSLCQILKNMRQVNIKAYVILIQGQEWSHDVSPCSKEAIQFLENNESVG